MPAILQTLALLAVAVLSGTALVRRQVKLPVPLLPIDLYRRPMFALSSLTSMCSFAAQGLAFVSLPFLFQLQMGRTAVETGLLLTPWPVATAAMAPVAGPLSDRFPPAILGGIGMALLAIGLALMATLPVGADGFAILWRMLICGAGFGFFQSPQPAGDHVERAAGSQRRGVGRRCSVPIDRTVDRGGASGAVFRG